MPAIDENAAGPGSSPAWAHNRTLNAIGAPLALLLIFSTSTVFVQASWPVDCFQIGVYGLTGAYLLSGVRGRQEPLAAGIAPWLVYLIPAWGVIQIAAHKTASTFETREAVLRWGALAAVFLLSQIVARTQANREIMLQVLLCFAAAMAVLCLAQMFSSNGRVLWIIPSGYPYIYGTFQYHNNYAEFVELCLPIALWRALRNDRSSWGYAFIGSLLYASVIGAASRGGAVLCTVELLAVILIRLVRNRAQKHRTLNRATAVTLVAVPLLTAMFTLIVGWQRTWDRFQEMDPFSARREFTLSAIEMTRERPWFGHGLDTFPEVYQRYAVEDFPFYANHAHNDWAEFGADGGIPFLLLIFIPFAVAIPIAVRHPWGIGLIAVILHACVDYPFPRPAVSGWMFAMLAMLYMARTADKAAPEKAGSSKPVVGPVALSSASR